MATGEAEANLVRVHAAAKANEAVAKKIQEEKESTQGAMSIRVAKKKVEASDKMFKDGTAVVKPGNIGDMCGIIASLLAIYGNISEEQSKTRATTSPAPASEDTDSNFDG